MEYLIENIANIGFPIAITLFLLVRIESKLNELNKSINELTNSILNLKINRS
ncbi:MAG: YvrJ family protein [Clostridia bacterium]|jgi:hypothetical protein|nr:YvrJ family protein [Clostridia bacterium]